MLQQMNKKILPTIEALNAEAQTVDWNSSVSRSIIINAPVEEVWKYVSNSLNALEWSVFFNHISPLPGAPDGGIGALRRCFRQEDEKKGYWDEITTRIEELKFRQIIMYNMQDFPFSSLADGSYSFVRQHYKVLGVKKTELIFQTQTSMNNTWLQRLTFKFYARRTGKIFVENLENIAAAIEKRPLPHDYY